MHSFSELMLEQQLFVKNSYTKFHENLTKGLLADTHHGQRDGHTFQIRYSFFTLLRLSGKPFSHGY